MGRAGERNFSLSAVWLLQQRREGRMAIRIAALTLGFMAYGGAALAQAPAYRADPALVAAAEREGKVTLYTTWIVDQLARPMIAVFEKRFPKIKVDYVRGDTS